MMRLGSTVTEAALAVRRSSLSNRARVVREANRRGKWFGILARVGKQTIGRAEARLLAAESAEGRDQYGNCAVPEHWRPIFKRAFVKAAIYASRTDRSVTVSSK